MTILNGVGVTYRLTALLVLNKVLSLYVGPVGFAIFGQVQNILQIITAFGGTSFSNAIIVNTSDNTIAENETKRVWATALLGGCLAVIIVTMLIIIFEAYIPFLSENFTTSISKLWIGFSAIFAAFSIVVAAILAGKQDIRGHLYISVITATILAVFVAAGAIIYGIEGAVFGFLISNILTGWIALYFIVKVRKIIDFRAIAADANFNTLIALRPFIIVSLVSAIVVPVTVLFIRSAIINGMSAFDAGLWEAMNRLSGFYSTFFISVFSFYLLPAISRANCRDDLQRVAKVFFFAMMPIIGIGLVTIYSLQNFIINAVFTRDFLPLSQLIGFHLGGDLLKFASWFFSYFLIAKRSVVKFAMAELIFATTYYSFAIFYIGDTNFSGLALAYFIAYGIYFTLVTIFSASFILNIYRR